MSEHCGSMLKEAYMSGLRVSDELSRQGSGQEAIAGTDVADKEGDAAADEEDASFALTGRKVSSSSSSSELFSDLSSMARSRLGVITERLQNKVQAMAVSNVVAVEATPGPVLREDLRALDQALKSSLKPDSRILTMLQQEVDVLGEEKRTVQTHIQRTESWADNLGAWQCQVGAK